MPVTLPVSSTVAMDGSADNQTTLPSITSSPFFIVALIVYVAPGVIVCDLLSRIIFIHDADGQTGRTDWPLKRFPKADPKLVDQKEIIRESVKLVIELER